MYYEVFDMSLKNTKQERKSARELPVGTIITRFKSAQQKQLLAKEQINNKKTKNKSPKKNITGNSAQNNISQLSISKNVDKPLEKINLKKLDNLKVENKEYYPNKLKRKVLNARIFLAPKHSLKVICGTKSTNKRKLHLPRKDIKYINEQKSQSSESNFPGHKSSDINIVDMVRFIEESGNFDDEDLLEILTCPSPVWWEEPPEGYIEEALFSQPRSSTGPVSIKNQLLEEKNKEDERKINMKKNEPTKDSIKEDNVRKLSESLDISMECRDKTFINKRSKLETLLGNIIKNKTIKPDRYNEIKTASDSNSVNDKVEDKNENLDKIVLSPRENEIENTFNEQRNSDFTDEDLLEFRDDYILNHLENLDIPIEATEKEEKRSKDFDIKNLKKYVGKTRRESTESISSDKNMSEEYLDLSLLDDDDKSDVGDEIKVTDYENKIVDEIKINDDENGLVDEIKIIDDENGIDDNIIVIDDDDEIEDEIKNIDDENEVLPSTSDKNGSFDVFGIFNKLNKSDFLEKTYIENNENVEFKTSNEIIDNEKQFDKSENDLVTIYQIINDDENTELNNSPEKHNIKEKINAVTDENNKKIHRYYKCQKILKSNHKIEMKDKKIKVEKKNKKIEIEKKNEKIEIEKSIKKIEVENKNNSIVISESDRIKYCFICSAIFDTDKCNYCLRKNLKRKYDDDEFKCDNCGSCVSSKQEIINHINNHSQSTHLIKKH